MKNKLAMALWLLGVTFCVGTVSLAQEYEPAAHLSDGDAERDTRGEESIAVQAPLLGELPEARADIEDPNSVSARELDAYAAIAESARREVELVLARRIANVDLLWGEEL
ncbi:MAG: hypothetical protein IPK60_04845 [Sandaracinaceae bacterium]|nr:hypothetical protein [Sandaracinaceae bacterium]